MRWTGQAHLSGHALMRALTGSIPKCLGSRPFSIRMSLLQIFWIGSLSWRLLPVILYYRSALVHWTTMYIGDNHLPNPLSSSCIVVFFLTYTCRFLLTRLASSRRLTWHRVSCTRICGIHAGFLRGVPNVWCASDRHLLPPLLHLSPVRLSWLTLFGQLGGQCLV